MEVDALLDTGSLARDFIAEDVVVRYNLKPVLSDTSYTVCSGLDNRWLKSILLRVTFFDESSNRYDTFDTKAHILKATPVDLIIGRDSIKKFNLFSNVPSQLGVKLPIPKPIQHAKYTTGPCDCPSEVPLIERDAACNCHLILTRHQSRSASTDATGRSSRQPIRRCV